MSALVRRIIAAGVLLIATAATAGAQTRIGPAAMAPRFGSWEVTGGAVWSDGFDLGSRNATETRNSTIDQTPVALFATSTRLTPASGGQARLGFYLTRSLSVESGVQYTRPSVSTRITGDFEQGDNATVREQIAHYVVDGSAVYHLIRLSFAGGKGVPFVSGGGGYVRDVHEGNNLIETGSEYHAGTGVKLWFGGGRRRIGLRADVGVSSRVGGFDFGDGRRTLPTAGISASYLF